MERPAEDDVPAGSPGILDSLRSMIATLVQLLHTRLELVTTELQEEMHRIASLLLWAVVAVFFGGLLVLMLAATVIIAAGPEYRLAAALGMTGLFALIVLVAVLTLRSKIAAKGPLLSASREELREDVNALRRRDVEREASRPLDDRAAPP